MKAYEHDDRDQCLICLERIDGDTKYQEIEGSDFKGSDGSLGGKTRSFVFKATLCEKCFNRKPRILFKRDSEGKNIIIYPDDEAKVTNGN